MARKPKEVNSKSAEILDSLLKAEHVSMTELASRVDVSREAIYCNMRGNMSFDRFLTLIDALGYGIAIKPNKAGGEQVEYITGEMCESCVHKKLSEALSEASSVLRG